MAEEAAAPEKKTFGGFSLATKKKGPVPTASATQALANAGSKDDDDDDDDEAQLGKTELVGEMVEGKADVAEEGPRVISAQGNTFHLGGAQHLRAKLDEQKEKAVDAEADADADAAPAAVAKEEPVLNADAAAAQALIDEIRANSGGSAAIFGANDDERYRMDVATRADEAAPEEYANMPIEEFGKAYLRGYNWEEGKGINGKGVAEPIEYVPRPQLLGLGAQPKAPDEGKKHKKFIKPGESREPKKDLIYVDEQGRQRHVKKVGDKLVERGPQGMNKGAVVAITSGPHSGLYARIVSSGGLKDNLRFVLRLTMNGEEVTVGADAVQPVRDMQLERQKPGFTHEQAKQVERALAEAAEEEAAEGRGGGAADRMSDGERGGGSSSGGEEGGGRGGGERKRRGGDDERGEERKHKKHKEHKSHRDRDEREHKEHKKHKSHKEHKEHKEHKSGGGGGGGSGNGAGGGLGAREHSSARGGQANARRDALQQEGGGGGRERAGHVQRARRRHGQAS